MHNRKESQEHKGGYTKFNSNKPLLTRFKWSTFIISIKGGVMEIDAHFKIIRK